MSIIEETLISLFFGDVWYFGILIFIIIALVILKLYKYAGAVCIPFVVALEVQYYNRLDENPEFAWAMIALLILVIMIAGYIIVTKEKR
jgi:hypothetical protein